MSDHEEVARAATSRPNLEDVPAYKSFFDEHEQYERIHIHLIGVRLTDGDEEDGIRKRRGWFGLARSLRDAVADPYVIAEAVGEDTGGTEYFPIHKHKFSVLKNCSVPLWDAKCVLIVKKGGCDAVRFRMLDEDYGEDEVLMEFELPRSEIPEASPPGSGEWKEFFTAAGSGSLQDAEFCFRMRVTDCADRIGSEEAMQALCNGEDIEGLTYSEETLPGDSDDACDNALLQCFRRAPGESNNAVIWVLGRNDCFMHPHVAKRLLFPSADGEEHNYDLYVLNYSMNGICRGRGFVTEAHYNSHNRHGDFDIYIPAFEQALKIITDHHNYETLLGYAHSTGGPVLLNYLIERGDADFDGFIFNSPFLDWGYVGGDVVEFMLENVGFLERIGTLDFDNKMGAAVTPDSFKDTPILYLDEEIVLSDWSARIWSQYFFPWGSRPLYKVPMTVGFAKGVTGVHRKLEKAHKKKRAVTSKPFLVITSRGDDVLRSEETTSRADWIGPGRCEIELKHNGHDVFLSQDARDTNMAIEMVGVWMKSQGFR